MAMKSSLKLTPQTSLKTRTTLILKITAAVGILGIVVTSIFFIISHFGAPKTTLAGGINTFNPSTSKTLIISEYAPLGHLGQKRNEFIELYNISDTTIDLSGFTLEYYENNNNTPTIIYLSGIIQADHYFTIAVRNGYKRKDKPTKKLSYDFIVPAPGWELDKQGYFKLNYGLITVDNAGSVNNKITANQNYDRTDVLMDGIAISDWTAVNKKNSTPGLINLSDLPNTIAVNTVGSVVNFGANSNTEPAVSIKSQGTVNPGNVNVKVKRGKEPNSNTQMIKRSVEIDATTQPDNVELVFYYCESELNGLNESDLALYSFYNNTWHYVGGVVDTINHKITATGVNHFSKWSAGPNTGSSLPISLLSFKGEFSGESVVLSWETATEENNDFFTIEHSQDGINFELVGTQVGAGNSNSIIEYGIVDQNPYNELTYYRLKQTDFDGKFEYFPPIAVTYKTASSSLSVVKFGPNPFFDNVNIEINSDVENVVYVQIFSMNGTLIRSMNFECHMGHNTIKLDDLGALKAGTYIAQIYTKTQSPKPIRLIKY